jgi:predicted SPOUT superfamily RNA methylase MTH1
VGCSAAWRGVLRAVGVRFDPVSTPAPTDFKRANVAIAIVDESYIRSHQQANVTTHDLAIVVVATIGNPTNNVYRQNDTDTNNDQDIAVNNITGLQANVVTIDELAIDTRQSANVVIDDHNR